MKTCLTIISILLSSGLLAQSVSDTIAIEEVTITADRIFKKEEAGQKTSRVDSLVLIDKVNLNLSDVLSENTTVYIKEHGRGALATASFRGTAATHTQVQWNGININSPMLGMVDFSLIPVYIIDDVSLEHGGSSIKGQSGGLGGSVQIENKVDWDNNLNLKYYQAVGSYASYDEFGQVALGNKKIQSKTRAYHNTSENNYSFINKSIIERPEVKNKNAGFGKKGFTQEIYYRLTNKNILSAKAWFQQAYRSLPTVQSYEGSDQANLNQQNDNTSKIVAQWKHYRDKSRFFLNSGYDYQSLAYTLENEVSGIGKIPAIYSNSYMHSFYNTLKYQIDFSENFTVETSADYKYFDVSSRDSVQKTGYEVNRTDFSVFGGIYYRAFKKINISCMFRDDIIDQNFSPLIFNLGLSYKPLSEDFVIKANLSRNYHHPTLNDLYWQPGGNPDLKPEEGFTEEFGLHYIKAFSTFNINSELTAYNADIKNWIIWLPSFKGYWEPFNIKEVKSYGLEYHLKIEATWGKVKTSLQGNYGITKSLNYGNPLNWGDDSYKKQLPFIPVHSGNILWGISYKGFYIRYQYNSYSERFTMTSNKAGTHDDSEELGMGNTTGKLNWYYPYHMNKITLGKEYSFKQLKLGLEFKINNLFNEEYRSVLNRYMPGRNYTILLMINYNNIKQ